MNEIVLDTETTGISVAKGHRIIEIGVVEIIDREITGNNYHVYINPEREVELGAFKVHGISNEILQDKPKFIDINQEFLEYIDGSELLIHNAPFDVGFIEQEWHYLGLDAKVLDFCKVTDSLVLARKIFPGQKNNLDSLCKRLGVDLSKRHSHGALLDSELLASVYLLMTRSQNTFDLGLNNSGNSSADLAITAEAEGQVSIVRLEVAEGEFAAHQDLLAKLNLLVKS